jgi:hypothetical protein
LAARLDRVAAARRPRVPAVPAAAVALQQAAIRNDNGRRMADAQSAGAIFRIDPVGVSFVLPGPSCVSRSMAM